MFYEFIEDTLIVIPFILKGYRLEEGEKIQFQCKFKTAHGDYLYSECFSEDNTGQAGVDGYYTFSLNTAVKGILPGRYHFSLELILADGASVGLKNQTETGINIIPKVNREACVEYE